MRHPANKNHSTTIFQGRDRKSRRSGNLALRLDPSRGSDSALAGSMVLDDPAASTVDRHPGLHESGLKASLHLTLGHFVRRC